MLKWRALYEGRQHRRLISVLSVAMDAFFETPPRGKDKPMIKRISFDMFFKEPSAALLW